MRRLVASVGVLVILGGSAVWGQTAAPQGSADADYQRAYAEAFEKSFRVAFRSKSVEQCVSSASNAKAAGYDVTPTCACVANTLLATKTLEELTAISHEASSAALRAVAGKCLQTNPPVLASKPQK